MSAVVKFYGTRAHAARRAEALGLKLSMSTVTAGVVLEVLKQDAGFCVVANVEGASSEVLAFLESEKLMVVATNGETEVKHPEHAADETHEVPGTTEQAPATDFDANDEATRKAALDAKQAERDAKVQEKERLAEEKAKARKERQEAIAASRAEVAKTKAEVKAAKAAAKAEAAAEKDKVVKEKPVKQPREPGEGSTWKDSFAKAPDLIKARLAEGKPAFREGTKRALFNDLLTMGATLDQLIAQLGWNKATVQSALYEMAHLMSRKVEKNAEGVYSYA